MKEVFPALLLLLLLGGCINNDQPMPTTSTIQETTTSTTESITTTIFTTTTEATTSLLSTTLGPECLSDEDCGLGGWCRQGICCPSYDSCGYKGECFLHDRMREDGMMCWNGLWRPRTTLSTTTTRTMTSTTFSSIPKRPDGDSCYFDSDCASGDCMAEVCCSKGQCGFDEKCYAAGQKRKDGRICQSDGSWKKPKGVSCNSEGECVTGYCEDNVCCDHDECGIVFGSTIAPDMVVGKCYNVGELNPEKDKVCFKEADGEVKWVRLAQPVV